MQGARTGLRAMNVTVARASTTGWRRNHGSRSGIRLPLSNQPIVAGELFWPISKPLFYLNFPTTKNLFPHRCACQDWMTVYNWNSWQSDIDHGYRLKFWNLGRFRHTGICPVVHTTMLNKWKRLYRLCSSKPTPNLSNMLNDRIVDVPSVVSRWISQYDWFPGLRAWSELLFGS